MKLLWILLFAATYAKSDNAKGNSGKSNNGKSDKAKDNKAKGDKAPKFKPEDAGPLSTCSRQAGCLEFDIWDLGSVDANGASQYSVCLWWDATNELCYKDGAISHACPIQGENSDAFKIEDWSSGEANGFPCVTVNCGETIQFGVKDGQECGDTTPFVPGVSDGGFGITCESGGSCGGNAKACAWSVTAPDCDAATTTTTTTTTTTPPPVSSSTTKGTTTTTTKATTATTKTSCDCSVCSQTKEKCELNCGCACQWEALTEEEGACVAAGVSANAFVANKEILYVNSDLMQAVNDEAGTGADHESGGMGYVMLSVEALIVAGAVFAVLLIAVGVCCIVKRRKPKAYGDVVPDEEVFGGHMSGSATTP